MHLIAKSVIRRSLNAMKCTHILLNVHYESIHPISEQLALISVGDISSKRYFTIPSWSENTSHQFIPVGGYVDEAAEEDIMDEKLSEMKSSVN